jgi:hypothetical protein
MTRRSAAGRLHKRLEAAPRQLVSRLMHPARRRGARLRCPLFLRGTSGSPTRTDYEPGVKRWSVRSPTSLVAACCCPWTFGNPFADRLAGNPAWGGLWAGRLRSPLSLREILDRPALISPLGQARDESAKGAALERVRAADVPHFRTVNRHAASREAVRLPQDRLRVVSPGNGLKPVLALLGFAAAADPDSLGHRRARGPLRLTGLDEPSGDG